MANPSKAHRERARRERLNDGWVLALPQRHADTELALCPPCSRVLLLEPMRLDDGKLFSRQCCHMVVLSCPGHSKPVTHVH